MRWDFNEVYRKWSIKRGGRLLNFRVQEGAFIGGRRLKERGVYSHNCSMHNKSAYGGNINRVCKCRAVPIPCTDSYCSSKSQYTVNVDIRILIHGHCAVIVSLACVADIITLGKDFTIKWYWRCLGRPQRRLSLAHPFLELDSQHDAIRKPSVKQEKNWLNWTILLIFVIS